MEKKIIFIAFSMEKSNGTERSIVNLANHLSKKYKTIEIISILNQKKACDFYIKDNIRLKSFDVNENKNNLFILFSMLFNLFYFCYHQRKENSIVIGSLSYINIILGFFCFLFKRKKMLVYACEHAPYEYPRFFVRFLRKLTYPHLDKLVCLNEEERDKFSKHIDIDPIVIPNIVDCNKNNICCSHKLHKNILFVGRLSKEKGIDLLYDVMKEFFSSMKNSHEYSFIIIGDGDLFSNISQKINSAFFSKNVKLLGRREDVDSFYMKSDILVMTSRLESFGLVIIEAMSYGVPVISFDIGSGPSSLIKDKENGFLIPKYDIEKYVDVLCEYLIEKERFSRLYSKECQNTASLFCAENVLVKWKKLLCE